MFVAIVRKSILSSSTRRLPINQQRKFSKWQGKFTVEFDSDEKLERDINKSRNLGKRGKMDSLEKAKDAINSGKSISQMEEFFDPELSREDPAFIEKMADRKIMEAMARGEFKDLPYQGKPLPGTWDNDTSMSPEEFVSYQLLKKNNVLPEWIEKRKAIFEAQALAKKTLEYEYRAYLKQTGKYIPPPPASSSSTSKSESDNGGGWFSRWFGSGSSSSSNNGSNEKIRAYKEKKLSLSEIEENFKHKIEDVNHQIQQYNVLVPMTAQLYGFRADDQFQEITKEIDEQLNIKN